MPKRKCDEEAALIVLTQIERKGVATDYALVRVRGRMLHSGAPASYPGTCMATVQPPCQAGEEHECALERAFKNLFIVDGLQRADRAFIKHELFEHISLVRLKRHEKPDVAVTNYGTFVPFTFIKNAKLSSSPFEGEMRFIAESDIVNIVDIDKSKVDKKLGVTSTNINAMFADQIESLKLAFKLVKRPGYEPPITGKR